MSPGKRNGKTRDVQQKNSLMMSNTILNLPKLILMQAHWHDDAERQNKGHDIARYLAEQQNI